MATRGSACVPVGLSGDSGSGIRAVLVWLAGSGIDGFVVFGLAACVGLGLAFGICFGFAFCAGLGLASGVTSGCGTPTDTQLDNSAHASRLPKDFRKPFPVRCCEVTFSTIFNMSVCAGARHNLQSGSATKVCLCVCSSLSCLERRCLLPLPCAARKYAPSRMLWQKQVHTHACCAVCHITSGSPGT